MAFARCYWRTGGLWLRLMSCLRQGKDPNVHRPSPPSASPPIPLATTAQRPEPKSRQREGAVRYMWTTGMCHTLWGQGIIIFANGTPLRATAYYFLDGRE